MTRNNIQKLNILRLRLILPWVCGWCRFIWHSIQPRNIHYITKSYEIRRTPCQRVGSKPLLSVIKHNWNDICVTGTTQETFIWIDQLLIGSLFYLAFWLFTNGILWVGTRIEKTFGIWNLANNVMLKGRWGGNGCLFKKRKMAI